MLLLISIRHFFHGFSGYEYTLGYYDRYPIHHSDIDMYTRRFPEIGVPLVVIHL